MTNETATTISRFPKWVTLLQNVTRLGLPICIGAILGMCLFCWIHTATLRFGLSQAVVNAIAIDLSLGLLLSQLWLGSLARWSVKARATAKWVLLGLLAVLCSSCFFAAHYLSGLYDALGNFGGWLEFSPSLVVIVLLAGPLALLASLVPTMEILSRRDDHRAASPSARFYYGIGFGLITAALLIGPWAGLRGIAWCGIIGWACVGAIQFLLRPAAARQAVINETTANVAGKHGSWLSFAGVCLLALLIGCQLATTWRMVSQLMATAAWFNWSIISLMFVGLGSGMLLGKHVGPQRLTVALLSCAGAGSVVLVGFSHLTELSLLMNASVSWYPVLILLRLCLLAVCFVPLGMSLGIVSDGDRNASPFSVSRGVVPCCLILGFLATRHGLIYWLGTSGVHSLIVCLYGLGTLTIMLSIIPFRRGASWQQLSLVSAAVMFTVTPWLGDFYQPERAGKLLFSTKSFRAFRNDVNLELLSQLDDGRHLWTRETEFGTAVGWKHRGVQVHVRKNGMPIGVTSTDTTLCPTYTAATLEAILPLSLHPAARNVLLLDEGTGVVRETASRFPIQKFVQIQSSRNQTPLFDAQQATADPRYQQHALAPELGVAALRERFDVIYATSEHSSLHHAAGAYSREHLTSLSRLLADQGILCQRIQVSDYGSRSWNTLAATYAAVFEEAMAFNVAPGEFIVLASRQPGTLVTEGWVARLQLPQVKRALADVSWDWSIVTNLACYDLVAYAAEQPASVNDLHSGIASLWFPLDVMRWGKKSAEIQKLAAGKSQRLIDRLQDDPELPNVLHRLSDVTARNEIILDHPDEPWVYRTALKERLKNNPRSELRHVKGEGLKRVLDVEDKRRMKFLEELGETVKLERLELADLESLLTYETPFDPLVSHFVHAEVAKLCRRLPATAENREFEFQRRLHLIYFGSQSDRSIRDATRCLELLTDDETFPLTADQRYDYLNALLEVLNDRWKNRGRAGSVAPSIALNDIANSLRVSEKTLERMGELAAEIGLPPQTIKRRREVIAKGLVDPLETYRAELLKVSSKPKVSAKR